MAHQPLLPQPRDPRHARMFELLRQGNQAEITRQRLKRSVTTEPDSVAWLRDTAIQSLRPAQAGSKGAQA